MAKSRKKSHFPPYYRHFWLKGDSFSPQVWGKNIKEREEQWDCGEMCGEKMIIKLFSSLLIILQKAVVLV